MVFVDYPNNIEYKMAVGELNRNFYDRISDLIINDPLYGKEGRIF